MWRTSGVLNGQGWATPRSPAQRPNYSAPWLLCPACDSHFASQNWGPWPGECQEASSSISRSNQQVYFWLAQKPSASKRSLE